jgi:serine/threonine protein kinase/Flp pilus assembly protein TadD
LTPERYQQIKRVFARVCGLAPEARAAYLDQACGADADLRAEVEALLAHDRETLPVRPRVSAAAALGMSHEGESAAPGSSAFGALPSSPTSLPESIGHYRIVRQIGQGGMGVVFEAEQEHPRRTIALKVIRPGIASPQVMRRFQFEANVLGRLQHPAIAQIYEAGTATIRTASGISIEQPFFAMEFVHGRPLTELLGGPALGSRQRLELFASICDAVQHAHQKGVIHRDLKPGNILVDERGQPKILDFGVARLTDADVQMTTIQTDVGQLIGTIAYMSPEQAAGDSRELDTRSDVYALGVLLYQLLTGRLPHDVRGKTTPEALRMITEADPTPLSSVNRVFRGDLDTIVAKALEKEKTRRYQSAAELAADVRHYLRDEPITARPASTYYQLQKFARRNRALVGGTVGIFVALVIGTVVSATYAVRATHAEELAEQRRQRAESEAAEAEAVSGFLVRMFESVEPEIAQGFDTALLRLLLDDAARNIDVGFSEQPEVRATLQGTIGWVYHSVGERDIAEPHLQAAYASRRDLLGADDPKTLASLAQLYNLRWSQGRFDEAEQLCRDVIAARRRVLGEYHPDTLAARYDVAGIMQSAGRLDDAEAELTEVRAAIDAHLGEDSPLAIQALNGLAVLHHERDETAEAIALYRRVLANRQAAHGDAHPATIAVYQNLATALHRHGDLEESEALHRRLVELTREVYGADHPTSIQIGINLAGLLTSRSKPAEAEDVVRDVIERSRRVNGPEHPDTIKAMGNLGIALRMQGKLDEAAAQMRETVELSRTVLGEDHFAYLDKLNSLAGVLYQQGRLDEAEPIVRRVVAGRTALYGADSFATLSALNNLGLLLIERGKAAEAEALFSSLVGQADNAAPPGHWFPSVVRSGYGRSLTLVERFEEAEAVLQTAYDALHATLGDEHTHTRQVIENLARLYEAWQKPDQASAWNRKLPPDEQAAEREDP